MVDKDRKRKKERKEKKKKKRSKERRSKSSRRSDRSDESGSSSASEREDDPSKRRRIVDKIAKHLEKHANTSTQLPYTDDNPFGDTNLTKKFVWRKKLEKQVQDGVDIHELTARAEKKREEQRMVDLERVKKRREEKEAEKVAREQELGMLERMRAAQEAVELDEKEEQYFRRQVYKRSKARMAEGRARPVDILARKVWLLQAGEENEDAEEEDMALSFDPKPPYEVFRNLRLDDMEDLLKDIADFKERDNKGDLQQEWWSLLQMLCEVSLKEVRQQDAQDRAMLRGEQVPAAVRESVLPEQVVAQIEEMLSGLSHAELQKMQADVQQQLESGEGDPEYWQTVRQKLGIYKAKARLREIQSQILKMRLDRMREKEKKFDVGRAMGWDAERRGRDGEPDDEEQRGEEDNGSVDAGSDEREAELASGAADAHALRTTDEGGPRMGDDEPVGAAAASAAAPRVRFSGFDELLDGEEGSQPARRRRAADKPAAAEEAEAGEDDESGRWSPEPIDPRIVAGQEIIGEEEDAEQLAQLRQLARYTHAEVYSKAAEVAKASFGGDSRADEEYMRAIANPAARPGGVHPMLRNIATAGPQAAVTQEASFRSGLPEGAPEDVREAKFREHAIKMMGADAGDRAFTGEVEAESRVYWWHNKYRPRKPRYFNRVHTGYEWNKYNQTHYDSDNPPPKVVQGYKFNIFYPDLIDKKSPEYAVEKDPESTDGTTCILRIHAGPPYEDISFRIVNKEWEYSYKRGFKCLFERGVLHLYFNFKRQRYRR